MKEREQGGLFKSFQDFCQRMYDCGDMNKRAVENLIRSGAFDSLGDRRSQLIAVYEMVLDTIGSTRRQNVEGQLDMFGMASVSGGEGADKIQLPDIPEYSATERMHMEKETTGLYLSGHPMTDRRPLARRLGAAAIHEILDDFAGEDGPVRFADGQNVTVAGIVTASKTRTTKNNTPMAGHRPVRQLYAGEHPGAGKGTPVRPGREAAPDHVRQHLPAGTERPDRGDTAAAA